jgi:hypothetical protein
MFIVQDPHLVPFIILWIPHNFSGYTPEQTLRLCFSPFNLMMSFELIGDFSCRLAMFTGQDPHLVPFIVLWIIVPTQFFMICSRAHSEIEFFSF